MPIRARGPPFPVTGYHGTTDTSARQSTASPLTTPKRQNPLRGSASRATIRNPTATGGLPCDHRASSSSMKARPAPKATPYALPQAGTPTSRQQARPSHTAGVDTMVRTPAPRTAPYANGPKTWARASRLLIWRPPEALGRARLHHPYQPMRNTPDAATNGSPAGRLDSPSRLPIHPAAP